MELGSQLTVKWDFPGGATGKEPACQYRRCQKHRFDLWLGKIPWGRAWHPTPVFLPGESPRTEEPRGLQPIQSQRIRIGWSDLTMHACNSEMKLNGSKLFCRRSGFNF